MLPNSMPPGGSKVTPTAWAVVADTVMTAVETNCGPTFTWMLTVLAPLNLLASMLMSREVDWPGCSFRIGTVAWTQPHETLISVMSIGTFQMLVIGKVCLSWLPKGTTPKLWEVSANIL